MKRKIWRQLGFAFAVSAAVTPAYFFSVKTDKHSESKLAHPDNSWMLSTSNVSVEPIEPISEKITVDPGYAKLGKKLFSDPILSANNSTSCSTCHSIENGGDDGLPRSRGMGGNIGARNALTVLNAALNFRMFWDGRASSLEEQVNGPLENPLELGTNWSDTLARLNASPHYQSAFRELGVYEIEAQNVRHALAEFERTLLTPGSRMDQYLEGDTQAITDREKHGYSLFKNYGCASCHQGRNVGGNMYQVLGVIDSYDSVWPRSNRGVNATEDLGRFEVTKKESDKNVFRVPSLRNVERTAPYFHDGSVPTLGEAVRLMGRLQLGRRLSDPDVEDIVAFLKTLSADPLQ